MAWSFFWTVFLSAWLLADASQPSARWNHATVLINNKLYLFGGQVGHVPYNSSAPFTNASDSAELWILDMTQNFNTSSPPWSFGPSGGPRNSFMSANYGGPKYELLVIYGDSPDSTLLNNNTNGSLYYYNVIDGQWLPPIDSGSSHPRRRTSPRAVNRLNDSSIIMYGGAAVNSDDSLTQLSDMWSLDTIGNAWTQLSPVEIPQTRYDHSSTLLSDGKIYLIGGFTGTSMVDMNEIDIFDTLSMSWSVKKATGDSIIQRRIHTAVGTSDNKIIIFGGTNQNYSTSFNDVAVFDSKTLVWESPATSGASPPPRYAQTMTMVGTNVIITYGATNSWDTDIGFFVLDTASTPYTWKTNYKPQNLDKTLKTPPSSNGNNPDGDQRNPRPWVISLVVTTGVVLCIVFSVGIFIFIKKKRRQNNHFTGFPEEKMIAESIASKRQSLPQDNLATKVFIPIRN